MSPVFSCAGGSSAGIFFPAIQSGGNSFQRSVSPGNVRGTHVEVYPYSKRVFPGGARVLYRPLSSPLVCLSLWFRAGSRDEIPEKNGLAHFFEHMVFKGTKRYPGTQLVRRVQALGGSINAGTSLDTTDFYILVPREFWKEALELLCELVREPLMSSEDIESEKSVVIQEIHMEDDEPEEKLTRVLYQEVFKNTPYGRSILGEPVTIESLSRDDLLAYQEEYFQPANLVLSVAGDVPEKELYSYTERLFGWPFPSRFPNVSRDVAFPEGRRTRVEVDKELDVSRTYGAFGFLCPGVKKDASFSLRLLAAVLGEGVASRMNIQLREKTEIVDSVYSAYSAYQAAGIFAVGVTFMKGEKERVREKVHTELAQIILQPPNEKECQRARNLLKGGFYQAMETAQGNADIFGRYDTIDTVDRIYRYQAVLNNLRGEDLAETAEQYLSWEQSVTVWVGPGGCHEAVS